MTHIYLAALLQVIGIVGSVGLIVFGIYTFGDYPTKKQ